MITSLSDIVSSAGLASIQIMCGWKELLALTRSTDLKLFHATLDSYIGFSFDSDVTLLRKFAQPFSLKVLSNRF